MLYAISGVRSVCGVVLLAAKFEVREEFFDLGKATNRRHVSPTDPSAATPPNASAKTMVGCRARELLQNCSFCDALYIQDSHIRLIVCQSNL
jgi:hypothetical protein